MSKSITAHALALALVLSTFSPTPGSAADPTSKTLQNRPVLSLPLLERKLILAHHMTAWIGYPGIEKHALNLEPIPPGSASDVVGTKSVAFMFGMVRNSPLIDLEDAVLHEIKTARRMGLDGFQFFYPIHMHDGFMRKYSLIVKTFIRQAERHHPDFRVTLCLSAPTKPASESDCREQWAEHIRWLLHDTATSPIWLRSPDGRLVFYTWVPDGLADPPPGKTPAHIHSRAGIAATAVTYEKLARAVGEEIAFIYHMRGIDADWYAKLIYEYFPAAWRWVDGDMSAAVPRLSALAQKHKRLFSPSVYPGFFGHTYRDADGNPNGGGVVGRDPVQQLWRPYHKTSQTTLYRRLLRSAVDTDAQLISFITWNDTTEATQLIPEVNYNFALGVLLNHYRNEWLNQPDRNDREIAIVAYKKHPLDQPLDTDVSYRVENERDFGSLADESRGEIVTILHKPAEVFLNGRRLASVDAGLQSTPFPFVAGQIQVQVRRNGRDVLTLKPSEQATNTPRRNDPVSFLFSSEFDRYFRDIFGPKATPYHLREYPR
ncbi:MAG: hypothetical protein ISQ14_03995 [Verrucomicrobiae bacterium]|nr:hypothetical protein [Verrucomicrobiae bacterium]